jgi:hypothetical protein
MAMLNALKNKVESTETKVEYSPNKITIAIQKQTKVSNRLSEL